jgi:hypothetical protein
MIPSADHPDYSYSEWEYVRLPHMCVSYILISKFLDGKACMILTHPNPIPDPHLHPRRLPSAYITGAGKHLYVRNVGAAPSQRHPMVAVALVYVSVQVTAVRVAQTYGKFYRPDLTPSTSIWGLPAHLSRLRRPGLFGCVRVVYMYRLYSSVALQLHLAAWEAPGSAHRVPPDVAQQ